MQLIIILSFITIINVIENRFVDFALLIYYNIYLEKLKAIASSRKRREDYG
jgi:hypothetical protein